ncbi:MAG TPA: slipin family protein [Candidatus Limnocylindrales bacterium]|nr:slipin family protein [Candidatus Limnocylindrales bacterium]
MTPIVAILAIGLLAVVGVAVARLLFDIVTIHDYERGLRYTRGRFVGLVDAGAYVSFRPVSEIRVIDARPVFATVEGQEVLTADGVSLKASLAARYVVADPAAAVTADQDFRRALYLILQLALREGMSGRTADEILASRAQLGPRVMERAASPLARLGLELLSVDIRDLMVPGELKRMFAGVVAARKEGEAALERARGETAALRNLANAARMLEDHPTLVQLRALQEIGASSGNTIVLGMQDNVAPNGRPRPKTAAPEERPSGR